MDPQLSRNRRRRESTLIRPVVRPALGGAVRFSGCGVRDAVIRRTGTPPRDGALPPSHGRVEPDGPGRLGRTAVCVADWEFPGLSCALEIAKPVGADRHHLAETVAAIGRCYAARLSAAV